MIISKKFLISVVFIVMSVIWAQAVQIELVQKVSVKSQKRQVWTNQNSYSKDTTRRKNFVLTVKNTVPTEIIALFFAKSGDKIDSSISSATITMQKPYVYEYTGVASSTSVNIDFTYIPDLKYKTGNDKVEAFAMIYDKKTGKFIGMKATSDAFANAIRKNAAAKIESAVKEEMKK